MHNLESRLEVGFGADSVRAGVWVWVWVGPLGFGLGLGLGLGAWEIMASKGFCAKVKRS